MRAPGEDHEPVVRREREAGVVGETGSAPGAGVSNGKAFLNLAEEEDPFGEPKGFGREPDLAVPGRGRSAEIRVPISPADVDRPANASGWATKIGRFQGRPSIACVVQWRRSGPSPPVWSTWPCETTTWVRSRSEMPSVAAFSSSRSEYPVSKRIFAPPILDEQGEPRFAPEVPVDLGRVLYQDRNPHSTPR